jgi:hypothetical protein
VFVMHETVMQGPACCPFRGWHGPNRAVKRVLNASVSHPRTAAAAEASRADWGHGSAMQRRHRYAQQSSSSSRGRQHAGVGRERLVCFCWGPATALVFRLLNSEQFCGLSTRSF